MSKQTRLISIVSIALVAFLFFYLVSWVFTPSVPKFSDFEAGSERKSAFFEYFLPIVKERNQEILELREQVKAWREEKSDISWWDEDDALMLAEKYRVTDFELDNDAHWQKLLNRVNTIPPSLALAQAANESAWGTSRFAREGYNYFGQWCFEEGCGIVPGSRDSGKAHEVKVFDSPAESVHAYILNLNSHPAYARLRAIREQLVAAGQPVTGIALAAGLSKYSERGEEYIKELRSMIRFNKLDQYDS